MAISSNKADRDKAAYTENATDGGTDRRVSDLDSHDLLTEIKNALGGTTDTTVTLFNVSVALADTEVSQALPANTRGFSIRARGNAKLKLAYTATESGTKYVTVMPGNILDVQYFFSAQTLYFQTTKAETVELTAYT